MANLYRDADVTTARPKAQAPLGARLEVVKPAEDPQKRWITVRLPSGEAAFVQSGDVRLVDAAAPRPRGSEADLVATARRFTGVPVPLGRDERARRRLLGAHQPRLRRQRRSSSAATRTCSSTIRARGPSSAPTCARATSCSSARRRSRTSACTSGDGRFINATTHTRPDVHEESLDDPVLGRAVPRGAPAPVRGARIPAPGRPAVIQDPLLVFAYLAALVALVFQLARLPALRPLFDRLPALVWTYFLPMLSTTVGHAARGEPRLPRHRALPPAREPGPAAAVLRAQGHRAPRPHRARGDDGGDGRDHARRRRRLPRCCGPGCRPTPGRRSARWWPPGPAAARTWWPSPTRSSSPPSCRACSSSWTPSSPTPGWASSSRSRPGRRPSTAGTAPTARRSKAWARGCASLRDKPTRPPTVADMTLMVGLAVVLTAVCLKVGSLLPPVGPGAERRSRGRSSSSPPPPSCCR